MSAPRLVFSAVCMRDHDGHDLLEGLSCEVSAGEALVLAGPEGSGKTSALHLALGDLRPDSGRVEVLAVEPGAVDAGDLPRWRSRIGHVPAQGALLANTGLFDNIALPLRWHQQPDEATVQDVVARLAQELGLGALPAGRAAEQPSELRVLAALARALVLSPSLLLLDEPCAGLGGDAEEEYWRLVWRLMSSRNLAIVVATADPARCRTLSDRVVVLPPRRRLVTQRYRAVLDL